MSLIQVTNLTFAYAGSYDNIFENVSFQIDTEWKLVREFSWLKVSEDVLYRPFDSLSNGEQTKVLLATLFIKENSFLLIDEPTNHLDRYARKHRMIVIQMSIIDSVLLRTISKEDHSYSFLI